MNERDLNHTWNCRHSSSCCIKSPDTTLSPGIILLWGLMATHCPIYQNKTVLCNLASLLLCNHQYIRSKKKDQLKACWGPGLGMCCGFLYCSLSRKAWQIQLWDPAGHAILINLSHWWTTASADLALVATHLYTIHLYHPEHNSFTVRYWELWAAVTHPRLRPPGAGAEQSSELCQRLQQLQGLEWTTSGGDHPVLFCVHVWWPGST